MFILDLTNCGYRITQHIHPYSPLRNCLYRIFWLCLSTAILWVLSWHLQDGLFGQGGSDPPRRGEGGSTNLEALQAKIFFVGSCCRWPRKIVGPVARTLPTISLEQGALIGHGLGANGDDWPLGVLSRTARVREIRRPDILVTKKSAGITLTVHRAPHRAERAHHAASTPLGDRRIRYI